MQKKREHWSGSFGFILAATGSAVGLGNLWRFPYMAWENAGGTFVLTYLFCVALIGFPIMIAEVFIGKRTQSSPVGAFLKLGQDKIGGKAWSLVGWLGVVTAFIILSFYLVVSGWSVSSLFECLKWSFTGYETPKDTAFSDFVANIPLQLAFSLAFCALTAGIIFKGISRGIEKACFIMMPALFAMLILLVVYACFLDGFGQSILFMVKFDFSKITAQAFLSAMGQAFFTLSLGMGAMITYGSYMKPADSITRTSFVIIVFDTLVALTAAVVMYTIFFSYPDIQGHVTKSTVGMLFITLPKLFYTRMPLGFILGPLFYILVIFAALTSTISLLEVVVSTIVDKTHLSRQRATVLASLGVLLVTILSAISLGGCPWASRFRPFGQAEYGLFSELNKIFFASKDGFLNVFDHLATNWLLPVGGFFIILFMGWFVKSSFIKEEMCGANPSRTRSPLFFFFLFLTRIATPVAIAWVIISVFKGVDFS